MGAIAYCFGGSVGPSKTKAPMEMGLWRPSKTKAPMEMGLRRPSKTKAPMEMGLQRPSGRSSHGNGLPEAICRSSQNIQKILGDFSASKCGHFHY